jgi:hypothetical protein
LLQSLASATGADVAASTDMTGAAAKGGDWVLEAVQGRVETAALAIPDFNGLLTAFTVLFNSDPGAGGGSTAFTTPLGGVNYTFTFTATGDGGSFSFDPGNGVGGTSSISMLSDVPNTGTTEKVTIARQDGADFTFTSIYLDVPPGGATVTVGGYLDGALVGSSQAVAGAATGTLSFGGIRVDEIRITSNDFSFANFDNLVGNTAPPNPTITSSAYNAATGVLTFPGSTVFGANDHAGPGFATELDSKMSTFGFGQYRTRVQLARCAANEEVVNGIFTYFNDGKDHDNDGLVDNSEIDIEILCGTPTVLSLTIWSQYTNDNGFKKWTRAIDLATGAYSESTKANEYGVTLKGTDPSFKHPGVPVADAYYELGFEWKADLIRYFIVLDGREITLWRFTDKTLIPTLQTGFLFNVWHPNEHWFAPYGSAAYPAHDAVMRLDWARYWRQ